MVRSVNRNNRRPAGLQSLDALLAAVHGAIIDDAKHTFGRALGLLVHDLTDMAGTTRLELATSAVTVQVLM